MNNEPEDLMWQRISKALFGDRRTTDEGQFTARVMREIRGLSQDLRDLAWPRFLRWAVPVLGVGVASLVLAARTPLLSIFEDPASYVSEDYP
jgi:hypothetical protein